MRETSVRLISRLFLLPASSLGVKSTRCTLTYRFRLRLASKQDGTFAFSSKEQDFDLDPRTTITLVARNAETLDKATTFHMDAGGFSTVQGLD